MCSSSMADSPCSDLWPPSGQKLPHIKTSSHRCVPLLCMSSHAASSSHLPSLHGDMFSAAHSSTCWWQSIDHCATLARAKAAMCMQFKEAPVPILAGSALIAVASFIPMVRCPTAFALLHHVQETRCRSPHHSALHIAWLPAPGVPLQCGTHATLHAAQCGACMYCVNDWPGQLCHGLQHVHACRCGAQSCSTTAQARVSSPSTSMSPTS